MLIAWSGNQFVKGSAGGEVIGTVRENVMTAAFRWSFVVLALIAVVLAAYMFRYEPISMPPEYQIGTTKVWDRWGHRSCVTSPVTYNKLRCDLDEDMIGEILREGSDHNYFR